MKAKWAWHAVLLVPLCASAGNQTPTAQTAAAVPITSNRITIFRFRTIM